MRTLRTQRGVVAVSGIYDRRIRVDVEHLGGHVAEQPLEIARSPRLAHPTGEEAVSGERVDGVARGWPAQGEGDRSLGVTLQVNDVEPQLADLDGVAVGED